MELIPLLLFAVVCLVLMFGYPVAFTLAGCSLMFAAMGIIAGVFDANLLKALPDRLYGTMTNTTMIAVPLFIYMGVVLEKSKIAEDLLQNMGKLCGFLPGGLGISVVLVGMLMAASTGIVGATVVTMGLMSLPTLLASGYSKSFATGTICATGTLGQIIPPSIALVLLGDILSTANQQAQLNMGVFNPSPVSVGDMFVGAVIPGLILVVLYIVYVLSYAVLRPGHSGGDAPKEAIHWGQLMQSLVPPLLLVGVVLGSIIGGFATPTEAAGVGATGALLLAVVKRQMSWKGLFETCIATTKTTVMVFTILVGASVFSLVFRGFGGEELIADAFASMPGGVVGATIIVMLVIFLLGFILDFIEITFVVVPLVAPALIMMGVDPIWLGIMIAVNLQTSFLTPPFGFALFYLRGVAPNSVFTSEIYAGVVPYIVLQLILLLALALWPALITWLPGQL
ncbi:TRAP transporter large permease subunit [Halioxenophilus sp. WMMB6]|uniref:TRAP transporter large permease n=1 Tax=Halioxenophilus sp. WMMB6 TaxID=3073815 RepID=UPI00295F3044|nr:TRAP transporter large permease subunit [Halioxenophilus sp. WMMB6]